MGLFDLFHQVFSPVTRATRFNGLNEVMRDERPDAHEPGLPPAQIVMHPPAPVQPEFKLPTGYTTNLPQRYGTFLVVDLYPGDLGGKPNWQALEAHSKVGDCEVVGAILKATEGQSYKYTDWFVKNAKQLTDVYRDRRGHDRFIGAYHFLQLAGDGVKQAEYFVRTMERAGMPRNGDIRPMLDFEQGGQYNFIPPGCPKDAEGHYDLSKLPDNVKRDLAKRAMDTTRACALRMLQLLDMRPLLYGRGLQRDLGMRLDRGYSSGELRMECSRAVNPAYTKTIPSMDAYGWPIEMVPLWQYGGDGESAHPKLPSQIPGFGAVDLSVHIDGPRKTSLDSFRKTLVL